MISVLVYFSPCLFQSVFNLISVAPVYCQQEGKMSNYNFSLTTFSSTGKLTQIEYALNAVSQGVTSIGIKGKWCGYIMNGVYI